MNMYVFSASNIILPTSFSCSGIEVANGAPIHTLTNMENNGRK